MDIEVFKDSVVVFVRSNQAWAAPIVFLLAFGESLAFVSLVLPATVILVGIGGLIGVSGIDLWPIWCAGVVGSILGYAVSYWVGLIYRDHIHAFWPFSSNPTMIPRGRAFFDKYGAAGVFLGHFFGPLRAVVPVVAGMCAMRQFPFQVANVSASLLWTTAMILPGAFGMKWLIGG